LTQVKILGTGHYAPENIVTNDDLAKIVDTSDEWITSRSGIKERRISINENTSDLASKAALDVLKNANISAEEIDLIIVTTMTPDNFTPSTACMVQGNIGATKAAAFDLSAACTGFVYGMSVGSQFIKSGAYKKVLVIGAEVISKIINWKDRNTCVLFGDGAGAVLLGESSDIGVANFHLASDGTKSKVLSCPSVPLNNPYMTESPLEIESYMYMEGREVFKFATTVIGESIDTLLKEAGMSKDDIKYIVPHQANSRIIEFAAKRLGIEKEKFYLNLDRYGNTSGASIPIALDEMNKKGLLQKGDKIILVGFGGGLTYGSILIQWQ
jgi:3-oxoacyl-[acyl-carrier-protein] synthase-3